MITKRGKRVRAVAILIGIWLVLQIATHVWWVGVGAPQSDLFGWCYGTMTECVVL